MPPRAAYRARGLATVPLTGILSVTTPGLLDAWFAVHERYGTLPLGRLLAPAVAAARDGIAVTGQLARWGTETVEVLRQPALAELYRPYAGQAAVGTVLRQPGLARLYQLVGAPGQDAAAVRALLGAELARLSAELDGLLAAADLAAPAARIGPALTARVGGRVVATTPAPTQGVLLLQNLAVYQRLAAGAGTASAEGVHVLSEIVQQTYGWRLAHLGDPDAVGPVDGLAEGVLAAVAAAVDPARR
ncbi:MAG TPA: gamma-glutamyltransferase, partial [Mycobacteriales bacterium]|nr:gamma-glutamyltransferase [Mycobacteriales bacterium]